MPGRPGCDYTRRMNPQDPIAATADDAERTYEKYMLRDAGSVRSRLQQLIDQHASLTATGDRDATAVTTLLALGQDRMWIDIPRAEHVQRQWLASVRLTFEGRLDRVTLRFGSGPARLSEHSGGPALELPLPMTLLHLQRREYIRREPPPGALPCIVPFRGGDGKPQPMHARIRDIGGGGLAVLVPDDGVKLVRGDLLPGCTITLPEFGDIEVTLRVQHISEPEIQGRRVTQAGCEFVDLRPDAQRKLFRYIMQLDREELARRRERD